MRTCPLGLLISVIFVTDIALAGSGELSNAAATVPVACSRMQAFMTSATTSMYSLAVNRSLDDWRGSVLGTAYRPKPGMSTQDATVVVADIGQIRKAERTFVKGELSPSNYLVRLKYYEAPSAMALRQYFSEYVVPTYSAGMPPINKTYGIGDTVLSWLDLDKSTNRVQFIAFFNNVAIECDITSDAQKGEIDTSAFMRSLEHWAVHGEGARSGP